MNSADCQNSLDTIPKDLLFSFYVSPGRSGIMLGVVFNEITLESLLIAAVLTSAFFAIYAYRSDGLQHIPSVHWSVPWSRFHQLYTKCYSSTKIRYYQAHMNLCGKDGFRPLVRVAPNEVC